MTRSLILLLTLFSLANSYAQKTKNPHSVCLQFNLGSTALNQSASFGAYPTAAYPDLDELSTRFDLIGQYDYSLTKWLALGTGLGLSLRGGSTSSAENPWGFNGKRDIYYINLPFKLQFKPIKFIWIEPGVEVLFKLKHIDNGTYRYPTGAFPSDQINPVTLTGSFQLRFNLLKRLSLIARSHIGLTDVAKAESINGTTVTKYRDYGVAFGLCYQITSP